MTETTARDDLEVRLIRDAGLSPHWAKRQVDAFAHELAEQQRALLRSKGTVWTGSIGQVINHIDPGEQPTVDAVPAAVPSAPADRAELRDRIAAVIHDDLTSHKGRRDLGLLGIVPRLTDAVLSVLPEPADRAALVDLAAATCSAQNRNYESGPRLCIRAAQHHGDHIDEHGFHWSDTVAVYPLADGQFRTGINVRDSLRRMAGEAQQPETQADAALRIRVLTEVLGRLTGSQDGDSATDDVPAATVRKVLAEILTGMQPGSDRGREAEQPAAVSQPVVARQADTAGEQQ